MAASPEHSATNDRARELKDRNRGSIDQWLFSGYDDTSYESPRPTPRTNTDEAKEYSSRNQGSLRDVMSMTAPESSSPKHDKTRKTGPPVNRCPTNECRDNMNRHGGQGMKGVFGMENANGHDGAAADADSSPAKTRTRPEAQANRDRNKGCMDISFGCDDGDGASPGSKQASRVKPEGTKYAERNKGCLTQQMKDYGHGERTPPPARRISNDAKVNAGRAAGTGIKDCFSHATTE